MTSLKISTSTIGEAVDLWSTRDICSLNQLVYDATESTIFMYLLLVVSQASLGSAPTVR